jgi:glycosyltransferase involved in cell wall biosynthesis
MSSERPLRILIMSPGGSRWTGGVTYRRNLIEALRQYAPQAELFSLAEAGDASGNREEQVKIIPMPAARGGLLGLVSKGLRRFSGVDWPLRQALQAASADVDVVFPAHLSAGPQVASLYWIPDFQYLHLPQMYEKTHIASLNRKFHDGAKRATLVVLSSRNAQEDFVRFAPEYAHKARVMHFVAHLPSGLYEADPEAVVKQYHLPQKFFYLPNQFWAHKNHVVVFEALKLLREQGIKPFVVCTGNPIDNRNPAFLAGLLEKLSLWGIRDQVAFLGLVPHDYVYMLIRQSIAVLNPSLFEGWSTTVEETKSVGKAILLSDLAVHREQDPPAAVYFDPHDAQDAAAKLADAWDKGQPGPDFQLERQAQEAFPERLAAYAATFTAIAREAAAMVGRR